ncbi:30S ribosomal protein S14 [Candidatus Riesia pediculischaeffi]|uniref:Small ribosomal subunit protein uS14 n=2 Tax=Candidatus Riesia pediculischaeffi TaxID=428411 RepID=A0A1V0HK61_9ENTR|nr:30S ribosomal protein S14 [Candidatus Riesia pediculischaeffi]ARC53219.1 30S ribosomal protein S14 [Candidatus Riesia pediculischaeffi]KIE64132.1 SSU ribosomal protein S14p (S29e) [Candidatus Riesia pediculischaeffi PTSU]
MSKKSIIEREKRRRVLSKKFFIKRLKLKSIISNIHSSEEERWKAVLKLQKLPRDSSLSRMRNRCIQTGRPRGFLRKFGISRMKLRELAMSGEIPGIKKSSW